MSRQTSRAAALLVYAFSVFSAIVLTDEAVSQNGGWRLLRTADPRGGSDAVSMSRIADITRSDINLAGLMLRCGEDRPEVAIVVVSPLPRHAQPNVKIGADGKEWHFNARVLSPGAELLLPAEATALAGGTWQSVHELSITVSEQEHSFGGVVLIDGLAAALAALAANCPVGPAK
jgi:hypothetical protein